MAWPWRRAREERRRVGSIDCLVVQQYDPLRRSTIGGIDTCLRGVLDYAPPGMRLAVVGVDESGTRDIPLGRWQTVRRGEREIAFLPVARIDPSQPKGVVPHSARLIAGLLRYRGRIPQAGSVQAHRVDVGWATRLLFPRTVSAPTWFDPAITVGPAPDIATHAVIWVGRLEVPKDPVLALRAFAALVRDEPDAPWTLDLIGSGSLRSVVEAEVAALPVDVADRITLPGRLDPVTLAHTRARCGVFLMTSHPGYEGFPRVLVEAMADGLPAVVTEGSDTGGLVVEGVSGLVRDRDPTVLAHALRAARELDRAKVTDAVVQLSAPRVVRDVFFPTASV